MTSLLQQHRFQRSPLSDEKFNGILRTLDLKFASLEAVAFDFAKSEDLLVATALGRINDTLLPAFEAIQGFVNLGDLLRAHSTTALAIGTGTKSFTIVEDERDTFGAPLYVIAASEADGAKWMAGQVTSFDRDTGALVVNVTNTRGSGTVSDWIISVASIPPEVPPAQSADNVNVTPAGGISATDVQAALEELDTEKADAAATSAALDGKADLAHSHAIGDVTGLQSALDGKADDAHGHVIEDVTGLQAALDGKADLNEANIYTRQNVFAIATLTDAATISWDLATQQVAKVTLAGNRTLGAPSNPIEGGIYQLVVAQDATGNRTLAFNTIYKFAGGTPSVSSAASARTVLTFVYEGGVMHGVATKGFA